MTSGDFFSRIETQYQNQLPFVMYRKPNRNMVSGLLQQDNHFHFTDNFIEKGFVFSPFDDTKKTVLIPFESSEAISMSSVISAKGETPLLTYTAAAETKQHHISLVKKGIKAIEDNQLKKVVLSRQETVNLPDANPTHIFKRLLSTYNNAFVYCWYHPKVGLWLGATPETLIKIEGKRFSIMALAGTQDYKGTLHVDWQSKEQHEQQLVTDFIVDNLESSLENFVVSSPETVKAGNLLHLKTMISAQLKSNTTLKAVIKALHPTPAVCGLPKAAAKQFILEHEGCNREFYTGFLGELNYDTVVAPRTGKRNIENRAYTTSRKSTQLYVNLRCMQLKNLQAIIYVGGGITKSSNAESEWEETVSKSLVIKSVL